MSIEQIADIIGLVCAIIVGPMAIVLLHIARSRKEKEVNKRIEEDAKMINKVFRDPSPEVIEQIKELEKRARGE